MSEEVWETIERMRRSLSALQERLKDLETRMSDAEGEIGAFYDKQPAEDEGAVILTAAANEP